MLLDYLKINDSIHFVDHDIDEMIVYAFISCYSFYVMNIIWNKCSLSETVVYQTNKTTHAVQQFYFIFYSILDLSETLIINWKCIYLNYFFFKLVYNATVILFANLNFYVELYSQSEVMRCALKIYRIFKTDVQGNHHWINKYEKSKISVMTFSENKSAHKNEVLKMFNEIYEQKVFEVTVMKEVNHYIAEENFNKFVNEMLKFMRKHSFLWNSWEENESQ